MSKMVGSAEDLRRAAHFGDTFWAEHCRDCDETFGRLPPRRLCAACGHEWPEHDRGGMCGGHGTVCHCVMMWAPEWDADVESVIA